MDIDHSIQWTFTQKGAKERFKHGIPIQNVVLMTVDGIQDNIFVGMSHFPPCWAKHVMCTIDHVTDSVSLSKRGCEHFAGSYENPRAKPCGRLTHIDWSIHTIYSSESFNIHKVERPNWRLHTIRMTFQVSDDRSRLGDFQATSSCGLPDRHPIHPS